MSLTNDTKLIDYDFLQTNMLSLRLKLLEQSLSNRVSFLNRDLFVNRQIMIFYKQTQAFFSSKVGHSVHFPPLGAPFICPSTQLTQNCEPLEQMILNKPCFILCFHRPCSAVSSMSLYVAQPFFWFLTNVPLNTLPTASV